jgi:hypothetical protein
MHKVKPSRDKGFKSIRDLHETKVNGKSKILIDLPFMGFTQCKELGHIVDGWTIKKCSEIGMMKSERVMKNCKFS